MFFWEILIGSKTKLWSKNKFDRRLTYISFFIIFNIQFLTLFTKIWTRSLVYLQFFETFVFFYVKIGWLWSYFIFRNSNFSNVTFYSIYNVYILFLLIFTFWGKSINSDLRKILLKRIHFFWNRSVQHSWWRWWNCRGVYDCLRWLNLLLIFPKRSWYIQILRLLRHI